jgi:predicted RND superfamily exporter protein
VSATPTSGATRARRYVSWLERRKLLVVVGGVLTLAVSLVLITTRLRLFADFSYLLPQDAPAVRDLRRLEERLAAKDTVLVLVVAPDAATRATVAGEVTAAVRQLPHELIERVEVDDQATRDFLRPRRYLLVPLPELEAARDTLKDRIRRAKLKANPLYVDLSEDAAARDQEAQQKVDDLLAEWHKAEASLNRSGYVSASGKVALVVLHTAFEITDVTRGKRLLAALDALGARVRAAHPGVDYGVTGGVSTSVAEHDAVVTGMIHSGVITMVLVALVLLIYLRSVVHLVLLTTNIAVATIAAFGAAALTVGHLNATTAFLGAIIAGNGVNYGIFLITRYLTMRREHSPDEAMTLAIAGTARPTAVASLGVAIAYGSLAITSFKGFADFAVIGAVGMLLCWGASFSLFPALVLLFGRDRQGQDSNLRIGAALARLFGVARPSVTCTVAALLTLAAGVVVWRYAASDPYEYNMKNLRSESAEAVQSRHWMQTSDDNFGRGISGKTFIAADQLEQVPKIVSALRAIDANTPEANRTIGTINSILDVVPADQPQRLAVLADIRKLLDSDALQALDEKDRKEALALRPPDDLQPIAMGDLPQEIKEKLVEKDGRLGYMIAIRPAEKLDEWNGHDLLRFASAVRKLKLSDGATVTTSGSSVIFADIFASIQHDGLIVTLVALLGLIVMVLLVVGRDRRAIAVLAATVLGSVGLIAMCALLGLKVNFLDFIALPITLGLGVDYAINIAHPAYLEAKSPFDSVRNSGSSVFICSLTTIVGYGSLMVSDNRAIYGFGLSSLIGEVTSVITALALVPAIIFLGRMPSRRRTTA